MMDVILMLDVVIDVMIEIDVMIDFQGGPNLSTELCELSPTLTA